MGMLDTWKAHKDVLANFLAWVRKNDVSLHGLPDGDDALLERFLDTQVAGNRRVPVCGHCGSFNIAQGDFKDELFPDMAQRGNPDFAVRNARTVPAHPDSHGPAWVCQATGCGHFTVREET